MLIESVVIIIIKGKHLPLHVVVVLAVFFLSGLNLFKYFYIFYSGPYNTVFAWFKNFQQFVSKLLLRLIYSSFLERLTSCSQTTVWNSLLMKSKSWKICGLIAVFIKGKHLPLHVLVVLAVFCLSGLNLFKYFYIFYSGPYNTA
jgi:branched-subunit amino acid transport protein AzlD